MTWNWLICERNYSDEILKLKYQIFITSICWTSFFNSFAHNVPIIFFSLQMSFAWFNEKYSHQSPSSS